MRYKEKPMRYKEKPMRYKEKPMRYKEKNYLINTSYLLTCDIYSLM
jgi:hypothetical protein